MSSSELKAYPYKCYFGDKFNPLRLDFGVGKVRKTQVEPPIIPSISNCFVNINSIR